MSNVIDKRKHFTWFQMKSRLKRGTIFVPTSKELKEELKSIKHPKDCAYDR